MEPNDSNQPKSVPASEKPSKTPVPAVGGPLASFEAWLYDVLVYKAPFQLPKVAKDWIVQYGPWIALVGGILAALFVIPGMLAAFSISSYTIALGSMYGAAAATVGPMLYLTFAMFVLQLVVLFIAIPMLLKRQRNGWLLLFYADIVSLVYSVVSSFSYGFFSFGSLLSGLIGAAIGFYLIFQIRSYYVK